MNARLLAVLSLFPLSARAGGFAVSEQDAQATGRAGASVGVSGSASALHFNPAGLSTITGVSAEAGATAILPSATSTDPQTGTATSAEGGLKLPPHVYGGYGFGQVAIGVGFNAPFGGGLKWPDTWAGRTELTQMTLQVLAGHLGGAWKINDQFSVGASATLYKVDVTLDKKVDFIDTEGTAKLGGGGVAFTGAAGATWTPRPELTFGFMGRLPATASLSGRAHFEGQPKAFASTLPDQAITTSLTLPGKLAFGASARLPWLKLFADFEYTFWSSFQSFAVDFSNPSTPDVNQPRNWANAPTFRLGAEKDLGLTTVRLGGLLDLAASPADTLSPSLPDSTRLGFSVGVGRPLGPVRADLAYQFVAFLNRTSTGESYPSNYSASAHLIAFSLSWLGSHDEAPAISGGSAPVAQR